MKSFFASLLLLVLAFFCSTTAWAQSKKITGHISNDDGKTLQNVSITVKGKTSGTQSLADGSYSIDANTGDVLLFSFVGYTPEEIRVGQQTAIDISLKAVAAKMEEVVVIGYGTQIRKSVTSSIGKLDNAVLQTAPIANVASSLQGAIAGVKVVSSSGTPGATPAIFLRGGASINAPAPPLVVVDGIVRPSLSDIPAGDIASIDLLRDAASTAIYGARANNGVILVTTKQGKSGKAQVSYKFTQGFNNQRKGYQYMNAHDFIYYNRLGNLNAGVSFTAVNTRRGYGLLTDPGNLASFDILAYTGAIAPGWDTVTDPYGPQGIQGTPGYYSGIITFKDHSGQVADALFQNTHTQEHFVDVTAGNDKGKFYSSFDYFNQNGIIVGSGYQRFTGNINGSYKINPNLEISSGATFSTSNQLGIPSTSNTIGSAGDQNSGNETNAIYRTLAIWPTFNPWLDAAHTQPNPGNGNSDGNPLYNLSKINRKNIVNQITANTSLKYDIIPGLYVKLTGMAYYNQNVQQSFTDATQSYQQLVSGTYSTTRPSIMYNASLFQTQFNGIINYTKTINEKHHLSIMAGSEYFGQKNTYMQVYGTGAPTDFISTANASTTFAAGNNYTTQYQYAIVSAFGRLTYDYDSRYLLTLVGREDGVSNLTAANRWGFFPGMSAGWNVHNEKFFANSNISKYISTLKPRISYGVNGNASLSTISYYQVQGVFGAQTNYNGVGGYLNTSPVNSGLKWEQSATIDYGADIGLLNNRVTIIADIYNRKTTNLLTNLTLPSYVGFSSVTTNLSTLQNKGYEISINANIIRLPNSFTWDVNANISYNTNKVLKLPFNGNANNRQGGIQVWDPNTGQLVWVGGLQQGQPLGNIYAFKQVSIFKDDGDVQKTAGNRVDLVANITGPNLAPGTRGHITAGDVNWLDVKGNDTIDTRDQVYIGNIYPKYTGGFGTTVGYKGVSLYVRFDYALGHTIYNDLVARTLGQYQGTFNFMELQKQAWSPTNTNTSIPKVYYADQLYKDNYTRVNNASANLNGNNSRFYEKGNYLACREMTLSYMIPKTILSKTRAFTSARVYASLNNIFYVTKFSGYSPEPPVNVAGQITGVYSGTYPTPRTYVIGVQVSL
ncbi:MAG: SusC/RagA family TonB-linked outer membrane protein [Bacteroidetes bacterium]|nr:SusC/RagA family TonB-linked outer membrane protein [Bacteroidota bacterium]MBS1973676.1 SusC/RagA family TonB-linked outer membrane protein [Bacteroidota bacterium]